jgi:hypothetical protein
MQDLSFEQRKSATVFESPVFLLGNGTDTFIKTHDTADHTSEVAQK